MLQIIDYSEKAIAVIGTEKGNTEQIAAMKGMKGKYNPSLRCGKGWVFSKKKSGEQVTAWVAKWNATHKDAPQPQTPAPQPQPSAPKAEPTPTPSPEPSPQQAKVVIPIAQELAMSELEGVPF